MVMSLYKIPLLLTSASAIHVALTPPNPTPSPEEQLKPKGVVEKLIPWFATITKAAFWVGASFESAIILLHHDPSLVEYLRPLNLDVPPSILNSAENLQINLYYLLGWGATLAGVYLRSSAHRHLGRFFTYELAILKEHRLITTGPYSYIRHPAYAGAALIGLGVMFSNLRGGLVECSGILGEWGKTFGWIWMIGGVVVSTSLILRMKREDAMLKKHFGQTWIAWKQRVRFWVLPGIL